MTDEVLGHDPLAWLKPAQPADAIEEDGVVTATFDGKITFDPEMTIRHIEGIYKGMPINELKDQSVTVDLSEVIQIDSAGLQVLLGLKRKMSELGGAIEWQGVSDDVKASAKTLGIEQAIWG